MPVRFPPASLSTRCGTWVYAHKDSVPAGERVGSAVVHLTHQQERALGNAAAAQLSKGRDQLLGGVADVHSPRCVPVAACARAPAR